MINAFNYITMLYYLLVWQLTEVYALSSSSDCLSGDFHIMLINMIYRYKTMKYRRYFWSTYMSCLHCGFHCGFYSQNFGFNWFSAWRLHPSVELYNMLTVNVINDVFIVSNCYWYEKCCNRWGTYMVLSLLFSKE